MMFKDKFIFDLVYLVVYDLPLFTNIIQIEYHNFQKLINTRKTKYNIDPST